MTDRRLPALLALAFAAFYAATTRGTFVYGDDLLMYQVTQSIVERGEVSVASAAPRGDVAHSIPGEDGRRYAKYAPGLSFVAIPFYAAGAALERGGADLPLTRDVWGNERTGTRVFAAGLTNALVGGLVVATVAWTLLEAGFGVGAAALTALLVGLATPLAHYSTCFLSEPLAALGFAGAAGATAAVARGVREGRSPDSWLLASGGCAAIALLAKLAHGIALPVLALATALALGGRATGARRIVRGIGLWCLPVVGALASFGLYNFARFGNPFASGYGDEATRFTASFLEGFAGLLVSPGRGAVWYAPPILLGVLGAPALWRHHRALALAALGVPCSLLLFYAKYYQWHGGGAWGPRLLVPALPLLVLPAAALLGRTRRAPAVRACVAAAAMTGAAVATLPLLVPYERHLAPVEQRDAVDGDRSWLWRPSASPIVRHAREAPRALVSTSRLLLGLDPLPGPTEKERPGVPAFAFASYGSHALLQWTRGALVLALAAGAGAVYCARRSRIGSTEAASQ